MSTQTHHVDACAFRGMTFAEVAVDAELCCCDPTGEQARAVEAALQQWRRRAVLSQTEVWYPREGDPVRLDDMSLRWKRNLLAFLERRAPRLKASAEWQLVGWASSDRIGEHAADSLDAVLSETMDTLPLTWLYRQPLVERLEQLIREGHDGPVDRFDATKAEAPA